MELKNGNFAFYDIISKLFPTIDTILLNYGPLWNVAPSVACLCVAKTPQAINFCVIFGTLHIYVWTNTSKCLRMNLIFSLMMSMVRFVTVSPLVTDLMTVSKFDTIFWQLLRIFDTWITGFTVYIQHHSSEIRGLCLMKWHSVVLQNLPYFWNTKTHILLFFSFRAALFLSLMNALVYVDIDQGIH